MKKIGCLLLVVFLLLGMQVPVWSEESSEKQEELITGSLGRLIWQLDTTTHTLNIQCVGGLPDLLSFKPWEEYKDQVEKLVLEYGVTDIPEYAFMDFGSIKEVVIPATVKEIGTCAFLRCSRLEEVKLPELVYSQNLSFSGCDSLKKISFYNPNCYPDSGISINAVICGFSGSAAQQFADQNGYLFEIITEPFGKYGDVNCDEKITADDARYTLRAAVGLEEASESQFLSADVDHNGDITAADARLILRAAVGLDTL